MKSIRHSPEDGQNLNDIFISYAHIDNEALTEEDKGWISQFHKVLDTRVAQLTGEKPRIWRDLKLGGNDMFDQAIEHQFCNARIMISIMSPRYLCLLYTSPSPRDQRGSRMPSSA